jgi:hypothetical protein
MAAPEDTRVTIDPIKLEQQRKYLDLLAVFHYVIAGLAAFVSLFALIYVCLGGAMLLNPGAFDGGDPPPAFIGCFILGLGALLLLLGWGYAALTAYAGRCLARRRKYALCLVSAAISCLFSPFGTVLGIFTIILLMQDGVREVLFSRGQETAAAGY